MSQSDARSQIEALIQKWRDNYGWDTSARSAYSQAADELALEVSGLLVGESEAAAPPDQLAARIRELSEQVRRYENAQCINCARHLDEGVAGDIAPAQGWQPRFGWTCRSHNQVQFWKDENGAIIVRDVTFSTPEDAEEFTNILLELRDISRASPPVRSREGRTGAAGEAPVCDQATDK